MYLKNFLRGDLQASIVVFLVALPLCLGIALASGAPLFSGLIAGVIGGIVVGALSGSKVSVSGPAAGLSTIVAAAILDLGSYQVFLLSVIIAGVIQLSFGFAKAGTIGHFFPSSVIKGMLAAIGLILILKQIPHAVGYDEDFEGDESFFQLDGRNTFTEILDAFNYVTPGAIIITLTCLVILITWNKNIFQRFKFFRIVPAPLAAVIAGILISNMLSAFPQEWVIEKHHFVSVPNLFGSSSNSNFTWPDFSLLFSDYRIYVTAIIIAIVASLETLLSIEACDKMDPSHHITPVNRELKAQGVGNIVSGLLGGLPVTSVIVRSSANINSGARSQASTISHGIILLISMLTIPGLLNMIPLSCLAAILLVVGYKLTHFGLFREMYKKGISQFLPFITTVVSILFTNLLLGVLLGIVVGLIFVLITNFQRAIILVNAEDNHLLKFTKDISFIHKAELRNTLSKVPDGSKLLLDGSKAHFMDDDIKETIEEFVASAMYRNIEVELKGIKIKDAASSL